jgi:2-amino-4-hydroxy-6-hydroxymethyldihydropteridine diphosphokinase
VNSTAEGAAAPSARVGELAYIGLGANLGDARASLASAVRALDALPVTRVLRCSRTYRSAPIEAGGPDYLNAVAELDTAMPPRQLLDALHAIEARHGRERPWRNAPRTLDLDLLLHGDSVCTDPRLLLPHPRMHARAFVLAPLTELRPDLIVPGHGPIAPLLAACAGQRCDPLPDAAAA